MDCPSGRCGVSWVGGLVTGVWGPRRGAQPGEKLTWGWCRAICLANVNVSLALVLALVSFWELSEARTLRGRGFLFGLNKILDTGQMVVPETEGPRVEGFHPSILAPC